ncbi:hypothetical protein GIB67_014887 [Kingdonia uniflora]|uniref:VQ domain-containing protein n=1 Tax=Kingdonia uniflora TaxID=39325 RepID=A0A7J7MTA2_9MAGN|nr:hypothetical protein GIB67_014887 [Kingdonia uniflora]
MLTRRASRMRLIDEDDDEVNESSISSRWEASSDVKELHIITDVPLAIVELDIGSLKRSRRRDEGKWEEEESESSEGREEDETYVGQVSLREKARLEWFMAKNELEGKGIILVPLGSEYLFMDTPNEGIMAFRGQIRLRMRLPLRRLMQAWMISFTRAQKALSEKLKESIDMRELAKGIILSLQTQVAELEREMLQACTDAARVRGDFNINFFIDGLGYNPETFKLYPPEEKFAFEDVANAEEIKSNPLVKGTRVKNMDVAHVGENPSIEEVVVFVENSVNRDGGRSLLYETDYIVFQGLGKGFSASVISCPVREVGSDTATVWRLVFTVCLRPCTNMVETFMGLMLDSDADRLSLASTIVVSFEAAFECSVKQLKFSHELTLQFATTKTPLNLLDFSPSTLQLSLMASSHQDPNYLNTTFVQADPTTFKSLVQKLTGATQHPLTPKLPVTIPARNNNNNTFIRNTNNTTFTSDIPLERGLGKPPFKLQERRQQQNLRKLEIQLNGHYHGSTGGITGSGDWSVFRQRVLVSPVSPLELLASGSPRTPCSPLMEEERAIAEKGFYLHPSPLSTPRGGGDPPELLPLFPLQSPRDSSNSNS